jgi:hypothetical protein
MIKTINIQTNEKKTFDTIEDAITYLDGEVEDLNTDWVTDDITRCGISDVDHIEVIDTDFPVHSPHYTFVSNYIDNNG